MTTLVLSSVGGFFLFWLIALHVTVVAHKENIADLSSRTRALQDQVNKLQREVRGR